MPAGIVCPRGYPSSFPSATLLFHGGGKNKTKNETPGRLEHGNELSGTEPERGADTNETTSIAERGQILERTNKAKRTPIRRTDNQVSKSSEDLSLSRPAVFCRSLVSTSPLVPTIVVVVERLQFHYVFPICSLFLLCFFLRKMRSKVTATPTQSLLGHSLSGATQTPAQTPPTPEK